MKQPDEVLSELEELFPPGTEFKRLWFSVGTLYLIHFGRPFKHAQHYLGWASNPEKRIAEHLRGRGSSLTKAVVAAGIKLEVVRFWEGDRTLERLLKNRHNLRGICPKCLPEYNAEYKAKMQRRRASD